MGIRKNEPKKAAAAPDATAKTGSYTVTVGGHHYAVVIDGDTTTVNGIRYETSISEGISAEAAAMPVTMAPVIHGQATAPMSQSALLQHASGGKNTALNAPMPAKVFKIVVNVGDHVNNGDPVIILEAMKMETAINATVNGIVTKINVSVGDQVQSNDVLAIISSLETVSEAITPVHQPQPSSGVKTVVPAPAPQIKQSAAPLSTGGKTTELKAPMPGKVFKIMANVGDHVNDGDPVIILEAMKMETAINATVSGTVTRINVGVGDQVQSNEVLALIS
jgi:biotin carboxyl carrier protein